jgi:hypothetical protein
MSFPLFFLVASGLLLVSVLFVIRRREPALRGFAVAVSATAAFLLAAALLRLSDPAAPATQARWLTDTITAANLSAATVLLVAWTVRLWRAPS